jgi:hypothetical protein
MNGFLSKFIHFVRQLSSLKRGLRHDVAFQIEICRGPTAILVEERIETYQRPYLPSGPTGPTAILVEERIETR